eukprot:982912-Alexandrium_andersonii.AAC.1
MVLCGDFNGPVGLYPAFAAALAARRLIDVEEVPGPEGQGRCSGTCRAHGARSSTGLTICWSMPPWLRGS